MDTTCQTDLRRRAVRQALPSEVSRPLPVTSDSAPYWMVRLDHAPLFSTSTRRAPATVLTSSTGVRGIGKATRSPKRAAVRTR